MSILLAPFDVHTLSEALQGDIDNVPVLLDVREAHEIAICALPNHVHIPLAQIPQSHTELPKDRVIAVYCHHGGRSAMAVQYLQGLGYHARNVTGGIHAWANFIDPEMPTY